MVPTSVVGVLVFVASVGPGYVYVKILERWRPYTQRTALRESAQIVVAGSLATLVAVVVALIVGKTFNFISTNSLARHPGRYVVNQPGDAGLALLSSSCRELRARGGRRALHARKGGRGFRRLRVVWGF